MEYTVWRHGVLLGRTDLEMPSPESETRMGQLETTPDFAQAWADFGPIVDEFIAAGAAVASTAAEMPPAPAGADPADRARQVYEWLSAHPGKARLLAANEAVMALGLELRDPTGHDIPTESVIVQEIRPPAWIPAADIARTTEEARDEGIEIVIPTYVVIVRDAVSDAEDGER